MRRPRLRPRSPDRPSAGLTRQRRRGRRSPRQHRGRDRPYRPGSARAACRTAPARWHTGSVGGPAAENAAQKHPWWITVIIHREPAWVASAAITGCWALERCVAWSTAGVPCRRQRAVTPRGAEPGCLTWELDVDRSSDARLGRRCGSRPARRGRRGWARWCGGAAHSRMGEGDTNHLLKDRRR